MGLFKKSSGAPPDIGQEEEYDKVHEEEEDSENKEEIEEMDVPKEVSGDKPVSGKVESTDSGGSSGNLQIESVNARIDSVVDWIKQFYDRFSYVSESIGEIRTMTMNNEKRLSEAMKEAEKVIDVVKEVKPEELRVSYQKAEMKMDALSEKIEANRLFMDEVMKEMNELRRKSEVFIGTDGIMKLNADTKKDLVEVQKLASKTKMQADKSQEIFMELRRGFAESQKVGAIVSSLDESYSGLKEAVERLRLDYGKIVKRSDYLDFKKSYKNKLALFEGGLADIESIKNNLSEMGDLVETSLAVSRRNEEDIGEIGMKIGAGDVKKVSDYENQIMEMLGVIEVLSKQVAELRKKMGLGAKKNVVKKIIKPSDSAREKVEEIKIAKVPKLKPERFLGKKNIVEKRGDADIQEARKFWENGKKVGDGKGKENGGLKSKGAGGGLKGKIKRIVTRVRGSGGKVEEESEGKREKKGKESSGRKKGRGKGRDKK